MHCSHKSAPGLWPQVSRECTCKKTWFLLFLWLDIRQGTEVCIIPTWGGRRTLLREQFWAHLADFPFLLPLLLHDGEKESILDFTSNDSFLELSSYWHLCCCSSFMWSSSSRLELLCSHSHSRAKLFSRAKASMRAVVLLCLCCPEDLLVCFLQVSELSDLFSSALFRALHLFCPSDLMEITESLCLRESMMLSFIKQIPPQLITLVLQLLEYFSQLSCCSLISSNCLEDPWINKVIIVSYITTRVPTPDGIQPSICT